VTLAVDGIPIALTVNGRWRELVVEPHHTLLEVLRDDLGLTGAKECCLVGECGACTVIVDGRTVDSCLMLAAEADGVAVLTIEGLADGGTLRPIQDTFLDEGGVQCGFCIPGQVLSAHVLLEATPHPTVPEIEEAIAGNLCRCGCYKQISAAILAAAETLAAEASDPLDPTRPVDR
jgi:aerobic-type carbon monoxide dehydrogenase small subunit (CoxS/CutS family)